MPWNQEKFLDYMNKVLTIYKKYNITPPDEFDSFIRLYEQLPERFEKNDNMQDIRSLLKPVLGKSKLDRHVGSICGFIVYDKTNYINPRYERLKVVISAPAALLDLEDPIIAARYRVILEITNKWGIESIVLAGIFDNQIRGLFKDICQLNLIRLDDKMLNDFIANCSHDIKLSLDTKFLSTRLIDFDHSDRWKGRVRALLEWNLPINISMENAIELAVEKRDLWNKIRDEMTHGLGVW